MSKNDLPFLQKTVSVFKNWQILIISVRKVQGGKFFQTQRKTPIFKKLLFTETNENKCRTFSFLALCFYCRYIAFFDKLNNFSFSLHQKRRSSSLHVHIFVVRIPDIVLSKFIAELSNLKIKLLNQYQARSV